jgi:hypothetical protein
LKDGFWKSQNPPQNISDENPKLQDIGFHSPKKHAIKSCTIPLHLKIVNKKRSAHKANKQRCKRTRPSPRWSKHTSLFLSLSLGSSGAKPKLLHVFAAGVLWVVVWRLGFWSEKQQRGLLQHIIRQSRIMGPKT